MPIWLDLRKKIKEKVILHEIKKGDQQAFIWLYDQYAPLIYRFISLKVNSTHDSEDLASEVFFRFWRQLEQTDIKIKNPRSFLYQIARNLVVDYYRKKAKLELTLNDQQEEIVKNTLASGQDLNQAAGQAADLSQIQQSLKKIKPYYQDLIIWHYLDDFSVQEIAQILEKPANTVRVQLHRALKALKTVIK